MRPARTPRFPFAAWLLVLAMLFLALPCAGFAQSPARVTLGEYRAALERARTQIAAAEGRDAQGAVELAAGDLAVIEEVTFPDGYSVRLQPLISRDDSRERALARLDTVIARLKAAEGQDDAARLASLDRVLTSAPMNSGGGLWEFLLRLLARLFGRAGTAPNSAFDLLDTLLTILAGAALVFILGRILQAALGNFMAEGKLRQAGEAGARLTVAGARRRAADFAGAGSYREAVRQLYLATLLGLEDRGLLRIDRSLTNREVLASVGRWAEVQSGLRPVVDTFETVWYGEREPDRETFDRYSAEVESAANLIEHAAALPQLDRATAEAA